MKKQFTILVSILFVLSFSFNGFSQTEKRSVDSLEGFNYAGALEHAAEMKTEKEKNLFLNHAKRTYKMQKYSLYPKKHGLDGSSAPFISAKGNNNSIMQGPQPVGCSNVDFESQNTTGWTVTGDFAIMTSGNDPYGGFPKVWPGGTASLRLNDDNISASKTGFVSQATRVIPVSAVNSNFQLHFAFAILNFPHPSNAAALFQVQFFDQFNNLLSCPQFTCYYANPPGAFIGMPPGTAQTSSVTGMNIGYQVYPVTYVPWQTISMDLSAYIGTNVTCKINCNWCIYNYDWGYCYIDADCYPPIAATNTVCPGTICAPAGMSSYTWTSPGNIVATTSCITAPAPGVYTVQYKPFSTCSGSVQTVYYTVIPPPTSGFTNINSCGNFTFTNTGMGAPAVQTYSFAGVGAPASFTTTNLTATQNFPAGTYTVYHTVANGNCVSTTTAVIIAPAGPNPAFTTPTYTQCFTGNSFVFTATQAATSHTFGFNPTAGAPATGLTSPYGPVSFTSPGTYTVTHTITNTGCTASASSVVVINPMPATTANNTGPACTGSSLTLQGGGGTTYSWSGPGGFTSAIQNPILTGITTANAGIYTVTATSLGCSTTATTNVSITTPTTSANNGGPYCAGSTIQLNSPAAVSFTWAGPGGFTSALQNPTRPTSTTAMSGVYSVTLNFGGCFATASTTVTVNALPVPVANNNSPICTGTTLNFTGGGGSSYAWSGPGFSSALQNPTIPVATSANAGVYTLTVTDVNSCTNTITTNVTINSTPTIAVNNPTVCQNQTIGLTSNGGASYSWNGPGGYTSPAQNPNIANSTLAMSGQYTVLVTSATGCTNTAVSTVSVYPLPFPAITSNTPCVGSTLNLTGNGGVGYSWTGPGFSSALQNPNINTVTMVANGTYSLLATVGTCTAMTTAVITINPLPNPNIVTNSPVCIGKTINFTGSGGVSYAWIGPGGFNDPNQNPIIPVSSLSNNGNYVLTVTDANGCVNSTNANVIVNPQPVVAASGTVVCENTNGMLSSSGGVSYAWTGPGGFTSNNQFPTILTTAAVVGQYTVLVTDAKTCTNTAVANLGMNPAPTPSANTNSPICINNVLNVFATGGVSFSWTGPNGFFSTAQSPTLMATSLAASGNYSVTVTDANGCTGATGVVALINPIPPIAITSGPNKGCAPLCVTFTAASTPSATVDWIMGDGSYTNANINSAACYHSTGTFTITASVVDANGCENTTTYTVSVYPRPIADFNYDPIKPIVNENADVHFTDASYGANIISWNWYFMNNASATSNEQNPTYVYQDAGQYVIALVVKSDAGCTDTTLKSIVVGDDFGVWVPNSFTPNGDGLNDIFFAKGFGIVKFEMNVFDRWGEKVFTSHDINEAWDGTQHNRGTKFLTEDTYTWIINVTNVFSKSKEFTGHVTLIK